MEIEKTTPLSGGQLQPGSSESNEAKHVPATALGGSQDAPGPNATPGSLSNDGTKEYLQGKRFWAVSIVITVVLFLVNMEATVVTTALVAITNELGGFDIVSWILSSYLLGYVGSIVVASKLSDMYGRKEVTLVCLALFIVFSGGCGAANSTAQVIVLRAFQGLGGGGCFALSTILLIELVPPHKYGEFVAYTGIAIAIASVTGPLIGGAISAHTTWRWIFLIKYDILSQSAALSQLYLIRIPEPPQTKYRLQAQNRIQRQPGESGHTRIDFASHGEPLLDRGLRASGNSLWLELRSDHRFVGVVASILGSPSGLGAPRFIGKGSSRAGTPLGVSYQPGFRRDAFSTVSQGFDAGVRVIPFAGGITVGSSVGAKGASRMRIPAVYVVLAGSALQIVGLALITTLPTSSTVTPGTYGYQVVAGFGCGISYSVLYLMIPFTTGSRDRAVGMGTGNQFRMMGSAVALAIATTVFRSYTAASFARLGIDPSQEVDLGQRILALSEESREELRISLALGYNRQSLVTCIFAAAQVPAALLMWKKDQVLIV
ncbi:hypothetical protein PG993_010116 [Apiospora rasikravindrae]|uniref:Major facilitator superfamily (MFS) profile domain-containing protein n=1 Tax=Apiospora rasikravindrae TaxID=990691 RepID=A0ABR1SMM1_9PEZI